MVDVTRNDKGEPTSGEVVAWHMRSGPDSDRWMYVEDTELIEEMRALGWEVQALGVIPAGVKGQTE